MDGRFPARDPATAICLRGIPRRHALSTGERDNGGVSHDHGGPGETERRLRLALGANVVIVVGQVVAGLAAHSLALVADAAHNLTDVGAVALSLGAVRLSRRRATGARSFGWHRGRVLAAQANAAAILAVTGLLFAAAIDRLRHPQPVEGGLVLAVAAVAAAVNGGAALLLRRERDLGVRSALVHLAADALSSVAVAVSGLVVLVNGGPDRLDPAVTIAVAGLILAGGWRLLRQTTSVLLEGTPHDVDPHAVTTLIESVDGVESAHDLHVWSLDGALHALSVHVVVRGHPTLEDAQAVGVAVKRAVSRPFGIAHATVELECEGCADDGSWCAFR